MKSSSSTKFSELLIQIYDGKSIEKVHKWDKVLDFYSIVICWTFDWWMEIILPSLRECSAVLCRGIL